MKILWTDGSASPNPGPGGFAVIEQTEDGAKPVALGRDKDTSNIKMEGKSGPIKNLELVQELYELYTTHDVKIVWVRGHVGTELNEMADVWANKAREGAEI